jgi:ubiquinone biosynthesis protein UbiJ
MKLPPLINTLANSALETQLRIAIRLDPFWREQLAELDGLHLYIELIDLGFKRVIQLGPKDVHCLAPFTQANVKIITRSPFLKCLKEPTQTQQAIEEGHIQLMGEAEAIESLLHFIRCHHADWETQLAQVMPDPLAYQLNRVTQLAVDHLQQAQQNVRDSYHFWRRDQTASQ